MRKTAPAATHTAVSLVSRQKALLAQITAAAQQYRRHSAPSPTLIAVSKQQPPERLLAALQAGQRIFGENRVQEAYTHWEALKPSHPELELHLIGPLQTNKAREAVALFDVIQTVDREKLADALATEMTRQQRYPECFIQVNTGEEPQKAGISPSQLPTLLAYAKDRGLNVTGLMCIPPANEPPAPHFALMKKLAARHELPKLSMGMSDDFETAIRFGATHVRIGSALFGARNNRTEPTE